MGVRGNPSVREPGFASMVVMAMRLGARRRAYQGIRLLLIHTLMPVNACITLQWTHSLSQSGGVHRRAIMTIAERPIARSSGGGSHNGPLNRSNVSVDVASGYG